MTNRRAWRVARRNRCWKVPAKSIVNGRKEFDQREPDNHVTARRKTYERKRVNQSLFFLHQCGAFPITPCGIKRGLRRRTLQTFTDYTNVTRAKFEFDNGAGIRQRKDPRDIKRFIKRIREVLLNHRVCTRTC